MQTENLSTKAFWEFQKGDSLYVQYKPKGHHQKETFLAEIYTTIRNRATVKIVGATVNPEIWKHKIEGGEHNHYSIKEKGWFADVQMKDCGFYGKSPLENSSHYYWFNSFGYAYKDIGLEAEQTKHTHPTYGVITISKPTSSGGVVLFGSNIQHTSTITLRIHTAELDRHLNNDWIHPRKEIIEVEMSALQFSDMITSIGNGGGTPVTIRRLGNTSYPDPPFESRVDTFQKEFQTTMRNLSKELVDGVKDAFVMLKDKPTLTKADRNDIYQKFDRFVTELNSNVPFVTQQFNESMEKTVTEAKAAIEQFFNSKITQLGIDAAKADPDLLIPQITQG